MMDKQQHPQAPRPAHRRQGGSKPSAASSAEQGKHKNLPAAEERYANNDDDYHHDKGGNNHIGAKNIPGTDAITSATRIAQLRTHRQHYNEKSHKPKMEHQQEAPAVNKRRHHHKRQGSLRRQQQQQNMHKVEEEVSSSRRRQQKPKAGVAEKQVHKKKGGATANENNILQVDELIKSARKRYGNVNDRGKNTERSGVNADDGSSTNLITTGAAKEIGRNKNKGRQKKKQPKQNNNDRKKNDGAIHSQQSRRGNDNRTSVKTRDDSDNDDSLPDNNCDNDKATTNDVHQRDDDSSVDNTEGRIGGGITTSPQSSGGESAISSDNVNLNLLPPPPLPSASRVRTEQELETQRRHAIKVQTFYDYDEDEDCENVECNLDYEEMLPDHLYQYQFSNRLADDDGDDEKSVGGEVATRGADSHQGGAINREEDRKEIKIEANAVGKNGWHRMLHLLESSTDIVTSLSASSGDKLIESDNKGTNSFDSTLDQRTVLNVLENPHHAPILSEEDALRDEYETLQREIESLEKDRLALESLFNEIETEKMRQLGQGCHISGDEDEESYRKFRQKLQCMKSEDLMSIPSMLWKEDVQLESPRLPRHNRRHRHGKESKHNRANKNDSNNFVSKMDAQFQESVREHRGKGLALLIADTKCKNALIEHCYTRYYMNKHEKEDDNLSDSIRMPSLRVEGAATMIHGGGEYLRSCGIIGQTSLTGDTQHYKGGTSYFLKLDGGKSYLHGSLPSNLMNRLSREEKESISIRYLSTGSLLHGSSSIDSDGGGERCYYMEFDSGECWWHVPSSQGEHDRDLQQIFSEVDVHRVAFGSSTSEIIDASASWIVIAKDGSVFYRNIPQGLHDTLTARDAEESHAAPCEVSLGVSGSYFIRFLDGCVDYNLPIFAADEFEKLESQGLLIRNVSLHVDTADCIMRFQ